MDILGLGAVAVDEILRVQRYPAPDTKNGIQGRLRQCGGLTATALVAAARFGAKCSYAGQLGYDESSTFAANAMQNAGVDLSHVLYDESAGAIQALIIAGDEDHTRTIFGEFPQKTGAAINWPDAEIIQQAKALFVDTVGLEGMIRAAKIAREANIPVVADVEGGNGEQFAEFLSLVDHLIIPQTFALSHTGTSTTPEAVACLAPYHAVVAVTCGVHGCYWTGEGITEICHTPAYKVQVVDTTGCGDVFHGVYTAALVKEYSLPQRILYASAAAAVKATRPGGQTGIADFLTIKQFVEDNSDELV